MSRKVTSDGHSCQLVVWSDYDAETESINRYYRRLYGLDTKSSRVRRIPITDELRRKYEKPAKGNHDA